MWTSRDRARYDRSKLRYPSDVTDEEWELIVPLIPPGKSGGGKRTVIMREVVNGLMYVLSTGCQWRAIPTDLPPKSTVYDYFDLWTYDGTLQRIHHALYEQCREQAQLEASPTERLDRYAYGIPLLLVWIGVGRRGTHACPVLLSVSIVMSQRRIVHEFKDDMALTRLRLGR